jgi:thioredoxin reductase (NADPH)
METNVAGLYIAGVVVAGYDANKVFIENGRHHGEVLVRAYRARAVTEGWHPAC